MRKKAHQALLTNGNHDFIIGEAVFIRTMTFHYTGRIIKELPKFIVLDEAAWIPEDGRFMQCIESGEIEEVEPVTVLVRVNKDHITDIFQWVHPLPRVQK